MKVLLSSVKFVKVLSLENLYVYGTIFSAGDDDG